MYDEPFYPEKEIAPKRDSIFSILAESISCMVYFLLLMMLFELMKTTY